MSWLEETDLVRLDAPDRAALARLAPVTLPRGRSLFHPGEAAEGFPLVLRGRVEVFLVGPSGRDILLYAIDPGETCVQTTLGLMGGEPYTGEALTARETEVVTVPKVLFLRLMDDSDVFRAFVFRAFAQRMKSTMHVLEKVAFHKIESRLAEALLDLAEGDHVTATQAELASRIGSAREVISRRLDGFARRGWVRRDRGHVTLLDRAALARLARIAAES
ncbi:Crp/Fnr family transcriptional regulator [Salibaculum halophilum]|uniref:Crp/Fnr family transcriptional regulator n=1 Tax=Salibaculum halophilum TaxID=1914408 RepID=UPI000A0F9B3B|nr:Crp/Fnr family transcriptional regulator [Salibaculum halophilum]